jgi:hypothetical protein
MFEVDLCCHGLDPAELLHCSYPRWTFVVEDWTPQSHCTAAIRIRASEGISMYTTMQLCPIQGGRSFAASYQL